jgi:hypothetical protein
MIHRRRFAINHLVSPTPAGQSDEAKIGARITPQSNGCWLFDNRPDVYGRAHLRGVEYGDKMVVVHRWVYELLVGPIPDGCHLHHECKTPGCVNPHHLVALSPSEHALHHHAERRSA